MTDSAPPLLPAVEAVTELASEAPQSPTVTPQPEELASSRSTPRKHIDSTPLPTDSLVSIPLSDTPDRTTTRTSRAVFEYPPSFHSHLQEERESWRESYIKSEDVKEGRGSGESELEILAYEIENHSGSLSSASKSVEERSRSGSISSRGSIHVDWESLDLTEALEDADADSDEVSSAFERSRVMC
jgi:hypothetical protein